MRRFSETVTRAGVVALLAAVGLVGVNGAAPSAASAAPSTAAEELPPPGAAGTDATPPAGFGDPADDATAPDPATDDLPPLPMVDGPVPLTAENGFDAPAPDPAGFETYHAPVGADPSAQQDRSTAATVHGSLTADVTPWTDGGWVYILANPVNSISTYSLGMLTAPGEYSGSLPAGTYDITTEYQGADNLIAGDPVRLVVTAGGDYEVDLRLVRGGVVTGSLTSTSGSKIYYPAIDVARVAGDKRTLVNPMIEFGPGTSFRIVRLPPGDYQLRFRGDNVQSEWWQDQQNMDVADPLHVGLSETVVGIAVVLNDLNTLRGFVRTADPDGTLVPAPNVKVEVVGWAYTGRTDENGYFALWGFADGTYTLRFTAGDSGPAWGTVVSQPYIFDHGGSVVENDAVVALGGAISGTVTVLPDKGGSPRPGSNVETRASILVPETGEYRYVASGYGASFTIPSLGPGDYLLRFIDHGADEVRNEYYDDAVYRSDATLVTVRSSTTSGGIHAQLDPLVYHTYRYGGADRYEVAAGLTQDAFAPGVPVLYIASGEKFPDALSAGPAAARQDGALLLVTHDTIPASTRAAIADLLPKKIVVVGGTATVSASVFTELKKLQPDITRIGGADRYEVSRNVIDFAFCGGSGGGCTSGAKTVFLATGANFPDALSAGPAAAHVDGAVLLVPGAENDLDSATTRFLARLGASTIFIAGGPASVSDGIEYALRDAHPNAVTRLSGMDRYDASATINATIFQTGETAFLASGAVFPDALSGGPVAATVDAPLYLVRYDCLPDSVWSTIYAYDPVDLILLGGRNTLSDSVLHLEWLCGP